MATNFRIEPLGKENFETWKVQARAILHKNKVWSYVDGTTKKPTLVAGDATSESAVAEWISKDTDAISDLVLIIAPNELKRIKGYVSSHDLWTKLQNIYQS